MNNRKLLFFDFETTGLEPDVAEVIEAAWKLTSPDALQVLEEGSVKVLPEHIETAHPKALEVNGYTPEAWTDTSALTQEEFFRMFHPKLRNVVLAGHNVAFDEAFLVAGCKRFGLPKIWHYQSADTQKLAWPLYAMGKVPSVSLKDVAPFFKVGEQGAVHRAARDVDLTYQVFLAQMKMYRSALEA